MYVYILHDEQRGQFGSHGGTYIHTYIRIYIHTYVYTYYTTSSVASVGSHGSAIAAMGFESGLSGIAFYKVP
jgi:hypothetical protein